MSDLSFKYFVKSYKKTGQTTLSFLIYTLAATALLAACGGNEKDLKKMQPYSGPSLEADNIETLYTDSAKIKIRMTAPKRFVMQNGDWNFPKGVYIEFYNENQVKSSTLKADSGVYHKEQNLYTVIGNVIIIDSIKSQRMNTEELNWSPPKQQIFTDKFVTIQTKDEVIKGQGLEAKQDFSDWRILKVTGTLPISQQ